MNPLLSKITKATYSRVKRMNKLARVVAITALPVIGGAIVFTGLMGTPTVAQAAISNADVNQFATAINQAANSKNSTQVSRLIADDALISVSRKGKTSTLDKTSYLNLLQSNWSKATNYQYGIEVNNIVLMGDQAKADIVTTEFITEKGVPMRLVTTSRTTFAETPNGIVLKRAICQLSIEQH